MSTTDKFICYLDILGFQSRIRNKNSNFEEYYKTLIKNIDQYHAQYKKIKIYVLSDSVVIFSDAIEDIIIVSFDIYNIALQQNILIRGALTRGQIDASYRTVGENIIIPYLGEGYLRAYEMEKEINCAAIYVDNAVAQNNKSIKDYLFKYTEIFPKKGKDFEKTFLVTDMDNYSVPQTTLDRIINEIPNLPEHDVAKFINTFCLYYKVMRDKYSDTNNLERYHQHWVRLLENLCKMEKN